MPGTNCFFVPGTNCFCAWHQLLTERPRGNAKLAQLARFAQNRLKEKAEDSCRFWDNHCETSGSAQIGQADDGP